MAELKKYFWVFVVIVLISGAGQTALATTYECNTEKVFTWKQGKLSPDDGPNARPNSILQFDDRTGVLYAAFNKKTFFGSEKMKVMQEMKLDSFGIGNLTAFSNQVVNGLYVSTNVFRLHEEKNTGIVFLHYISLENRIATGKCHITQKIKPWN